MRVDVVVILEPGGQLPHDGDGVWPWVHAGIVALKGFDEGLADAVAFRASDWREARNKVQRRRAGEATGPQGLRPEADPHRYPSPGAGCPD